MKKFISVAIVALMVLLLVSCGEKTKSEEASATTIAGTEISESAAQDETTVQPDGSTVTGTASATTKAVTADGGNAPVIPVSPVVQATQAKPQATNSITQAGTQKTYVKNTLALDKKTVNNTMTSPITNTRYKLKFIDDFTGTSLNMNNWSYQSGNSNAAEEQANLKENVSVENGNLVFTGKEENPATSGGKRFSGGSINSSGKKTFKYGRLEIYCKIPYSYGMWPAFWTVGTESGWPWGGEIDIMEFVGGVDAWNNYRDDEYNTCLHWCDPDTPSDKAWGTTVGINAGDPDSKWNRTDAHLSSGGQYQLPNAGNTKKLNDEWHLCGVEWNASTMYFYCDGTLFNTMDITKRSMREAFQQAHYIILNLAMGGSWAGTPSTAKGTVWPQQFKIDWVKVWQKA